MITCCPPYVGVPQLCANVSFIFTIMIETKERSVIRIAKNWNLLTPFLFLLCRILSGSFFLISLSAFRSKYPFLAVTSTASPESLCKHDSHADRDDPPVPDRDKGSFMWREESA